MIFSMVGIAHAQLAIREQVSFTDQAKLSFQQALYQQGMDGCVIVSTCNRSEVYCISDNLTSKHLVMFYREFFHLSNTIPCTALTGQQAITHLFKVCAGLDSQILGEDQILKQVKDAYTFAQTTHMSNKAIHLLFQEAFHFAKACKQTLKLSEHPRSTTYLVYKFLKERELLQANIVLCGSGDVIRHLLPYVSDANLVMLVRNMEKVKDLQKQYSNLSFAMLSQRYEQIKKCDVLISATASPHILFKQEEMPKDGHKRVGFDMAVPRDIDETLKACTDYEVYDIDEIQQYLNCQNKQKEAMLLDAQVMLKNAVEACVEKIKLMKKEPVIAQMKEHLTSMSLDTYTLLNQKLTLSVHEQRLMKKTLDYSYLRFLQDFVGLIKNSDDDVLQVLESWIGKGGK